MESEIKKNIKQEQNCQNQQNNPLDSQIYNEMTWYQKNTQNQNFKTRGSKKKEKLDKLRANLKDPQLRKQRNKQRHQKQKQKLNKKLDGLSQQQIRQILDKRKYQKQQIKKKVKKAVQDQIGIPFLIDIAYQHKMNQKQNKSLATQIQLIVKSLKHIQKPPNVHLCGTKGLVKQQLQKNMYQYWPIKSYSQNIQQIIKSNKFKDKKIYYLSPDANQPVQNITQNDLFIIGGLVDRTVIKNASLNRAEQLGVQARTLPIRQFMKQRTCLNLDHIVNIVCKFNEIKDWKVAFDYGAPKRWKKQEIKGNKNKQTSKQQQQEVKEQQNQQSQQQNQKQIYKEEQVKNQ